MSLRAEIVRHIQQRRHLFKVSDEILKTLFAARGGGPLSVGLAVFSSMGIAMDVLVPSTDGYDLRRQFELRDHDMTIGGFLCETLLKRMPHDVIAVSKWGTTTHLWRREDGTPLVGAMFQGPKFSDGPFLKPGTEAEVLAAVREVVWSDASELKLAVLKSDEGTWRAAGRFHLGDPHPLGPYIARKQPEWYAGRLARFPKGKPLTALLRGPTGVGKSVLARHIAKLLRPDAARMLKVSSEVLKKCRSDEVRELVAWFQPTVLLLDDLNIESESESQFFLDLLETLRDPNTLVIVTKMTKFAEKEEPKPGCWHFPGMRTDRIDIVFTFWPPDPEERGWILDHYGSEFGLQAEGIKDALIAKTEGLTGAFLKGVAMRLGSLGLDDWEEEVNQILYTAPFELTDEDDEDGSEDGTTPEAKRVVENKRLAAQKAGLPVETVG